jgi:transcriptional regulator with XRE-family HTH domain
MFWDIFFSLCKKNEKSPNAVAKELSIASGTVTAWKNGKVPHHGTLLKLADHFGVSVDYLLGKEEKPADEGELSETEKQLIDALRDVPDELRERAFRAAVASLKALQ